MISKELSHCTGFLPGVDFGHVLGNAFQEADRISFLSDQNNVFIWRTFVSELLMMNLLRLFTLKEV